MQQINKKLTRRKRIAIFGFYNARNVGDDRIQQSLVHVLSNHVLVFFPHYLEPPHTKYLHTFDWILIGGGGLVFKKVGIWNNLKKWLSRANRPFGVVGVGANTFDKSLGEDLCWLADKAQFFYVRDNASKLLLGSHKRVEVLTDLTWCLPFMLTMNEMVSGQIALNLAPCPWKQYAPEQWAHQLKQRNVVPLPLYFTGDKDYILMRKIFGESVPNDFDVCALERSQLLVGCRYHSLIFAMQLRKPFIAIKYDDKVASLLEEAGLEDLGLETHEYERINERIEYVQQNELEIVSKIARYAEKQETVGKELANKIRFKIDSV